MPQFSADEQRTIKEMAERHQVSLDAVLTLLAALQAGGGRQAQFSHPELGGMGQWSLGGMVMIGDMFNSGLKARVDGLCGELSAWLGRNPVRPAVPTQLQSQSQGHSNASFRAAGNEPTWWPSELGTPASAGAQNDLRYAFFPRARCLAINHQGQIALYDTGEHRITGVSQQQGRGQSVIFTSQHGVVQLADLPAFESEAKDRSREPPGMSPSRMPYDVPSAPVGAAPLHERPDHFGPATEDIVQMIERLAELRRKGVLTEDEFTAKKTELLARL
jgi:hypothetical protein